MGIRPFNRHFPHVDVSHGRVQVSLLLDAFKVPRRVESSVNGVALSDTVHAFEPVTMKAGARQRQLCVTSEQSDDKSSLVPRFQITADGRCPVGLSVVDCDIPFDQTVDLSHSAGHPTHN